MNCKLPPCNVLLCRYHEIATKGANRASFERRLCRNLVRALGDKEVRAHRERGRIYLHAENHAEFSDELLTRASQKLSRVFGLESFSPAARVPSEMAAIEEVVYAGFDPVFKELASRSGDGTVSYRMRARRSDKLFPLKSKDVEIHFADVLLDRYSGLKLDLSDAAEITIGVEIREKKTYVFFTQVSGPGGLPSGSSDSALALLSGGIDSPVACYLTMKRGCALDFLLFHSYPYTSEDIIVKVTALVQILDRWQCRPGRLFAANLAAAQKIIRDVCTDKYGTILYRRLMLRVATELARRRGARALVTGEAVGQVASQTISNLDVINRATDMLILRPVIGMDKIQTINMAREIGTLDISEEQCPDSCTVFEPTSPSTGARLDRIEAEEERLDMPALVTMTLEATEVVQG